MLYFPKSKIWLTKKKNKNKQANKQNEKERKKERKEKQNKTKQTKYDQLCRLSLIKKYNATEMASTSFAT